MPDSLMGKQVINKIWLFAQVSSLSPEDLLCSFFISHPNATEEVVYNAFLCNDSDPRSVAHLESANATSSMCWRCLQPEHITKSCPHTAAFNKLVAQCIGQPQGQGQGLGRKWKNRNQGNSNTSSSNANSTVASSSTSNSSSVPSQESAGVAACFFSSHSTHTDRWLVDSGATSSMTCN